MARKSAKVFKDRGNNGWGQKVHRIQKDQPEVQVTMVLQTNGKIGWIKTHA